MSERPDTEIEMVENPNGPSQRKEEMPLQDSCILNSSAAANNTSQRKEEAQPLSNINGNSAIDANSQGAVSSTGPLVQPEATDSAAEVVSEVSENAPHRPASIASGELNSSDQAIAQPSTIRKISENTSKSTHTIRLRRSVPRAFSLPGPIAATILLIVVAAITFRANSPNWPLARITAPMGIFLLTIFSKLLDFFLEWATGTVWEKIQWGPLMKSGEKLLTYLALSAGPRGWMKILFLRHRHSVRGCPPRMKNIIGFFSRSSPRMWSLIRILFWGLIQFPGVIIMTLVNQQTTYIPVNWIEISGGLGIYDPKMVIQGINGPTVSGFVLFLLKDTTMSIQTDPVTDNCQSSDSCTSFLLPGGLKYVAPWPYMEVADKSLTAYITKDAPAYQIDVWNAPDVINWTSDDCRIYGIDNSTAFQLCISAYNGKADQLVAGWRSCHSNVLPSGECNQTNSWASSYSFSTLLAISRRTATTASDRFTSNILEIQSLGPPTVQEISPQNFSLAINTMICAIGSESTLCLDNGPNALLTTIIWINIQTGQYATTSTLPVDYLRNLLVAPLILFNPVTSGIGISSLAVNSVQPGLAPENYVNGSLARPITYVAPEEWTVVACVSVASLLLGLSWVLLFWAMRYDPPETSAFAFLDLLRLRWNGSLLDIKNEAIQDVFLTKKSNDDGHVLRVVGDV